MKNKAFTLAEILVTLGIIGIVVAVTLPLVNKAKPDNTKIMFLKTYQEMVKAIQESAYNTAIYQPTYEYEKNGGAQYITQIKHPLLSVYGPEITLPNGDVLTNAVQKNKICNVMAAAFGVSGSGCNDTDNTAKSPKEFDKSFTIKGGVDVWVTTKFPEYSQFYEVFGADAARNDYFTVIYFDVNGSAAPNCYYHASGCKSPDRFKLIVSRDAEVYIADPVGRYYYNNQTSVKKKDMTIDSSEKVYKTMEDINYALNDLDLTETVNEIKTKNATAEKFIPDENSDNSNNQQGNGTFGKLNNGNQTGTDDGISKEVQKNNQSSTNTNTETPSTTPSRPSRGSGSKIQIGT